MAGPLERHVVRPGGKNKGPRVRLGAVVHPLNRGVVKKGEREGVVRTASYRPAVVRGKIRNPPVWKSTPTGRVGPEGRPLMKTEQDGVVKGAMVRGVVNREGLFSLFSRWPLKIRRVTSVVEKEPDGGGRVIGRNETLELLSQSARLEMEREGRALLAGQTVETSVDDPTILRERGLIQKTIGRMSLAEKARFAQIRVNMRREANDEIVEATLNLPYAQSVFARAESDPISTKKKGALKGLSRLATATLGFAPKAATEDVEVNGEHLRWNAPARDATKGELPIEAINTVGGYRVSHNPPKPVDTINKILRVLGRGPWERGYGGWGTVVVEETGSGIRMAEAFSTNAAGIVRRVSELKEAGRIIETAERDPQLELTYSQLGLEPAKEVKRSDDFQSQARLRRIPPGSSVRRQLSAD